MPPRGRKFLGTKYAQEVLEVGITDYRRRNMKEPKRFEEARTIKHLLRCHHSYLGPRGTSNAAARQELML